MKIHYESTMGLYLTKLGLSQFIGEDFEINDAEYQRQLEMIQKQHPKDLELDWHARAVARTLHKQENGLLVKAIPMKKFFNRHRILDYIFKVIVLLLLSYITAKAQGVNQVYDEGNLVYTRPTSAPFMLDFYGAPVTCIYDVTTGRAKCTISGGGSGTNVTINGGGALTDANFNNTTPVAPANNSNITWQIAGSDVSGYIPYPKWNWLQNPDGNLTLDMGTHATVLQGSSGFPGIFFNFNGLGDTGVGVGAAIGGGGNYDFDAQWNGGYNATTGYSIGYSATLGHCLVGDGTYFVDDVCGPVPLNKVSNPTASSTVDLSGFNWTLGGTDNLVTLRSLDGNNKNKLLVGPASGFSSNGAIIMSKSIVAFGGLNFTSGTIDSTVGVVAEGYSVEGVAAAASSTDTDPGGTGVISTYFGLAQNVGSGTVYQLSTFNSSLATRVGSGNVTEAIGFLANTPTIQGGTVATSYGLKIEDQNTAVTNYAIKTGLGLNSFGDRVGIGADPGAGLDLDVQGGGIINANTGFRVNETALAGKVLIGDGTNFVPGDPLVQGLIAHDAAAAAINPVLTGFFASATAPSDVSADNDSVRAWALRNGSQVINLATAGTLYDARQIRALTSADTVTVTDGAGALNVIIDSGSTVVTQGTGTNLHTVVDSGSITATQATGTNLHVVTDATSVTTATLNAETTKVIGTVRNLGNAGAAFDSATGAAPPANGILAGGVTSGATGGFLTGIPVCTEFVPVNITTATTTLIVTGVSGRHVYICGISLVTAAANNVAFIAGTGATCGTSTAGMTGGTTAASGYNFAANGGLTQGSGVGAINRTETTGDSVCIVTSANTQLSGALSYAIY